MKKCVYLFTILLGAGCVKDKPVVQSPPDVHLSNARKIYVINEGNFTYNNSSVSLYDPGNSAVVEDFFKSQNNTVLGDVTQSMTYFQNQFFIVVNNSGKIVVCDDRFRVKYSITGFTSPRYMLPVSNSKAYVSDFKSSSISILNIPSATITGSIYCPGWTEQMVMIYNKVFVTNKYRDYVYVINTITDTRTDSVYAGYGAGSIVIDKNDYVWVLSSGDPSKNIKGFLKRIDPVSLQVLKSFEFAGGDYPASLCLNKSKDTLYYLNNGICRMTVADNALPPSPFIAKGSKNFYGIGVNPDDYCIYAADALDYVQKSNIYIYDVSGNQKHFFKAGINSSGFYFE